MYQFDLIQNPEGSSSAPAVSCETHTQVLRGRLNRDKAGRRPEKHTSQMQVASPGNRRGLVLMGTLAKGGCFGKPETTAGTKGLLVGCSLLLCIHRPPTFESQMPPTWGREE